MRAALTFALCAATALAQHVVVPGTVRHGDIVTTRSGLTLPAGDFTVAELVDAVAGYLCRNYLYDPDVVAAARGFTLQRAIALDALGSEEVLYALLAARDLVAVPLDEHRGIYFVTSVRGAPDWFAPMAWVPWRTPTQLLLRPQFRELVLCAVPLQHADANAVVVALRAHFALQQAWQPGAPTVSAAGPRTLILQGYGDQLAQTIQVLQQIDRSVAPPPGSDDVLRRLAALEREVEELRRQLRERR